MGSLANFEPWRRVDQLPERAPIRRLRPDQWPRPPQVHERLKQDGIDPESATAILSAVLRRGWYCWLIAEPGHRPRFTAYILEWRYGAVWAVGIGATPKEGSAEGWSSRWALWWT